MASDLARRRWTVLALIAALVILVAAALIVGGNREPLPGSAAATPTVTATSSASSPTPAASSAPSASPALARSVSLDHTYDVELDLMAAAGGRLFGVGGTESGSTTIVRIDPDGTITRRPLSDPLASYYAVLDAQGSSLYLGTRVIERFSDAPDELLRIDPATLEVVGRTTIPGNVMSLVADGTDLWVGLPDRVLRLDPVSLDVRASRRIPDADPPPAGDVALSSLAPGPGGLLATAGGGSSQTLYRFEPVTLAVLGHTDVPNPQAGASVVADGESAWLAGEGWVQPVGPSGQLGARTSMPGLQGVAAQGSGLLLLVDRGSAGSDLLQLDAAGAVVGSSPVGDTGARIALDGRNVWTTHGSGVARWTLVTPRP